MKKVAKKLTWIEDMIHDQLAKEREAVSRTKSGRLALSQIGKCERDLWAGINGIPAERHPEGRILVLFDLGNAVEGHLIALLNAAGFEVTDLEEGSQIRVVLGDRASGRLDGEILLELEDGTRRAVLETKSANAKKFDELIAAGSCAAWNPVYHDQVQIYMHLRGRICALVIVECKDDSRLWVELIDRDIDRGVELAEKANRITTATCPPPKPKEAKSQYCGYCKWCDRNAWCWSATAGVRFDD